VKNVNGYAEARAVPSRNKCQIHIEKGIEPGDRDSLEQKIVLHPEPCTFDLLLKGNSLCGNDLGEIYRLY
jgi:hypothetical protein